MNGGCLKNLEMVKSAKGQARREEVSEVSRRLLMRHLQVLRRSLNCGLIRIRSHWRLI